MNQVTSLDEEGMVDDTVYAPAMIPGAAANPAYASPSPPPPSGVQALNRSWFLRLFRCVMVLYGQLFLSYPKLVQLYPYPIAFSLHSHHASHKLNAHEHM
jgi:hypothetical protein